MLDEICRFMKQDDSIETDTPNCARSQKFSKCIQIAELKDMIATVTSVGDGGKVNVQAHANETVMNLQFEPDDLLKVFKCGDHSVSVGDLVPVVDGPQKGKSPNCFASETRQFRC